jgi:hypothetical protein
LDVEIRGERARRVAFDTLNVDPGMAHIVFIAQLPSDDFADGCARAHENRRPSTPPLAFIGELKTQDR